MDLDFNKLPYVSVVSLILIKYHNFKEIKDEICNNNTFPVKMVLILFTILIFSALIEYNLGHYFILLLMLMVNIIQSGDFNNDCQKNIVKNNIDDKLFMYVMFLFGSFIVTSCYMSKKTIICALFIIFGLCILFSINYLVLVTSDPSKKSNLQKMMKNMFLGIITPTLVLAWCENERKPLVKYVKLFYRK
jgi:hypothetical protein